MTPNHPMYNILDTFVCQTVWVKMSNSQGVYFWPHVTCAHVGVNHVTCKDDVIMTSRIYQLCSCFIVFYYSEISCLPAGAKYKARTFISAREFLFDMTSS